MILRFECDSCGDIVSGEPEYEGYNEVVNDYCHFCEDCVSFDKP